MPRLNLDHSRLPVLVIISPLAFTSHKRCNSAFVSLSFTPQNNDQPSWPIQKEYDMKGGKKNSSRLFSSSLCPYCNLEGIEETQSLIIPPPCPKLRMTS